MDKVEKLKEIIVNLQMSLIAKRVPNGYCPYTYYPSDRNIDCDIGCEKCREIFMKDIEKKVREEVDKL